MTTIDTHDKDFCWLGSWRWEYLGEIPVATQRLRLGLTSSLCETKLATPGRITRTQLAAQTLRQGTHVNSNEAIRFDGEVVHLDGEIVLALRGHVDASTAAAFRAAVDTFDGEGSHLVFDVSGVAFMDSSGLSVIAETVHRQQRAGGSLCIRNPRRQLRESLRITGLAPYLTIDG